MRPAAIHATKKQFRAHHRTQIEIELPHDLLAAGCPHPATKRGLIVKALKRVGNGDGIPGTHKNPAASSTSSGIPPLAAATTGKPQAMASFNTWNATQFSGLAAVLTTNHTHEFSRT